MKTNPSIIYFTLIVLFLSCKEKKTASTTSQMPNQEWEQLLDKDLSKWQPFLGIPHKSSGISGYEDVENVKVNTIPPLGLGNKNNVFSVIEEDGVDVLKITGEIFGSLMTKEDYENYHLKFQVKWGEKQWEPMLTALRNNGLLYHSIGEPGKGLWNTWMTSLEFEIENTNFGDLITINDEGNIRAKCPAIKKEGKYYYDENAPLVDFGWKRFDAGRCFKSKDFEKPLGAWTTVELVCYNDIALHIIEGEVVAAVYQAEFYNGKDWVPMTKGKLQLQSEAAETYFKNIEIKSINKLEERFHKYIK
jgi:hypothetical protein